MHLFQDELFILREHFNNIVKSTNDKIYKSVPIKNIHSFEDGSGKTSTLTKEENLINSTFVVPEVEGLNEIAGSWEVKKILKCIVVLPRNQPQLFANRKPLNSILLFGPPGTGKTHLVHALAYETNARFHCVTVSDILKPFVGESER